MGKLDLLLATGGIVCTVISIYQLVALGLASFYTLFSVGMSLIISGIHNAFSEQRLFSGWSIVQMAGFWILMLIVSVIIDSVGMRAGYWEYPHYGKADRVRKYVFEWGVALFYHFAALVAGIKILNRKGLDLRASLPLSLLIFVTAVGFLTESLNQKVSSWQVVSMPITNLRIGDYFLVFQTIGYWLMALIPFTIYKLFERRTLQTRRN
ncbi:MAG: hypothetical protein JW852_05445 [Spirochaetales bacterium]|nr:hypothetical protein [Spirochaetales bacterium]